MSCGIAVRKRPRLAEKTDIAIRYRVSRLYENVKTTGPPEPSPVAVSVSCVVECQRKGCSPESMSTPDEEKSPLRS
jgi:hypothetical protein